MRILIWATFDGELEVTGDLRDANTVFGGYAPVVACSDGTLVVAERVDDIWTFSLLEKGTGTTATVYEPGASELVPSGLIDEEDRQYMAEGGGAVLLDGDIRWVAYVEDETRVVRATKNAPLNVNAAVANGDAR